MRNVLVAALFFWSIPILAQTYTFTGTDAHSRSIPYGDHTLQSIKTDDDVVAALVTGTMTTSDGLYTQVVAFRNAGIHQLDVDSKDCFLRLEDGTLIPAMDQLGMEKLTQHMRRKQFWSDLANEGVTRLNANSASNLGADNVTQTEIVASGVQERNSDDSALSRQISRMASQSFMSAGLQSGESIAGRLYFQVPKDKRDQLPTALLIRIGDDQMEFSF